LDLITDDVDLSLVPSLRVLSLIITTVSFRHRIHFPFRWVLRRLKTAEHGNCIKEISIFIYHIRMDDNLTPSESDIFPWEEFAPLLTENFPRLRKIQFLFQTDDPTSEATPILWKAVNPDDSWAKGLAVKGLLEIKEVSGKLL
jgi:hypothetical protein